MDSYFNLLRTLIESRFEGKNNVFEHYIRCRIELNELLFLSTYHFLSNHSEFFSQIERKNRSVGSDLDARYLAGRWEKMYSKPNRNKFNDELKSLIFVRDDGHCSYCNSSKKIEIHHVIPRAKNGSNSHFNLVCACQKCNRSIGDTLLLPFNWFELHPESNNKFEIGVFEYFI